MIDNHDNITEHELYDFSKLPLTNEQKILEALLRIEQLLIKHLDLEANAPVPSRNEQVAALAAAKPAPKGRFGGRK